MVLSRLTPCAADELPQVSLATATVHADLLLIHPFREGNGRLGRWLVDIMAIQAGYPAPAYGFSGMGSRLRRAEYLQAVKGGYLKDYLPLARFFEAAILRRTDER